MSQLQPTGYAGQYRWIDVDPNTHTTYLVTNDDPKTVEIRSPDGGSRSVKLEGDFCGNWSYFRLGQQVEVGQATATSAGRWSLLESPYYGGKTTLRNAQGELALKMASFVQCATICRDTLYALNSDRQLQIWDLANLGNEFTPPTRVFQMPTTVAWGDLTYHLDLEQVSLCAMPGDEELQLRRGELYNNRGRIEGHWIMSWGTPSDGPKTISKNGKGEELDGFYLDRVAPGQWMPVKGDANATVHTKWGSEKSATLRFVTKGAWDGKVRSIDVNLDVTGLEDKFNVPNWTMHGNLLAGGFTDRVRIWNVFTGATVATTTPPGFIEAYGADPWFLPSSLLVSFRVVGNHSDHLHVFEYPLPRG